MSPFNQGQPLFTSYPHIPLKSQTEDQKRSLGTYNLHFQAKGLSSEGPPLFAFLTDGKPQSVVIFKEDFSSHSLPIDLKKLQKKSKPIAIPFASNSDFAISPDGTKVLLSKYQHKLFNHLGKYESDLWVYHLEDKRLEQITFGERAKFPSFHPDGNQVVYTSCFDSSCSLVLYNTKTKEKRYLIDQRTHKTGLFVESPSFSKDGSKIVFTKGLYGDLQLFVYHLPSDKIIQLTKNFTNVDPVYVDNKRILFSSNRLNNIYNIYELNDQNYIIKQLTHVSTGAFGPQPLSAKQFTYSRFSSLGYRFYIQNYDQPFKEELLNSSLPPKGSKKIALPAYQVRSQSESKLQNSETYRIFDSMIPFTLIPKFKYSKYQATMGIDLFIKDHLDKVLIGTNLMLGSNYLFNLYFQINSFFPVYTVYIGHGNNEDLKGYYTITTSDQGLNSETVFSLIGFNKNHFPYYYLTARADFPLAKDFSLGYSLILLQYHMISAFLDEEDIWYQSASNTVNLSFTNVNTASINPRGGRETLIGASVIIDLLHEDTTPLLKTWFSNTEYIKLFDHQTLDINLTFGYCFGEASFIDQFTLQSSTKFSDYHYASLTYPNAGFERHSATGETLFLSSLGYRFPLARHLRYRFWGFYFTDLYSTLFTSAGNVWGFRNGVREKPFEVASNNGNQILTDVGVQFNLASLFLNVYHWNSQLRIAYGFQDTKGGADKNRDGLLPIDGSWNEVEPAGFRYYLSIGSNF